MTFTLTHDSRQYEGRNNIVSGFRMTRRIEADTRAEAQSIMDRMVALRQKEIEAENEEPNLDWKAPTLPVRTTKEIQAEAMTPEALRVRQNTRGITWQNQ